MLEELARSSLSASLPPIRLLARRPDAALRNAPPGLISSIQDTKVCDYSNTTLTIPSLVGIKTLLFISATESEDRLNQHRAFIDAASSAGVSTIIYTSFLAAAPDAIFHHARDHYYTEEYIKDKGLRYVFLRNAFYQDILPHFIVDGAIRGPAGTGHFTPVAKTDVARVIATILVQPGMHQGRSYEITGPERVTFEQVAQMLRVGYVDEIIDEAVEARQKGNPQAPRWLIDAWISTYTAIKEGEEDRSSEDVARITGTAGLRFEDWLRKNRASDGVV